MALESTASGSFAMRQPERCSAKTHCKWSLALTTPLGYRHADGIGAKVGAQDRPEPGHQKMFRLDKIGQFVSNGQSVVPSGAVADMHLADGSQPAHHLDNARPGPPAGAGTLHGVGLAVADAYDGLETERPADERLRLAAASALLQILQGVDHDKAVVPPNRPTHTLGHLTVVGRPLAH